MVDDKTSKTRELLLNSAERLFIARGYDAVGTREIADAAGVNLGAIQYHFGSKGKLFIATVHRLMELSGTDLSTELELELTPKSKLEAAMKLARFISGFLSHLIYAEGPQACRLMIREIMTDSSRDEEMFTELVSSVAEKFMRPMRDALEDIVRGINSALTPLEVTLAGRSILGQCLFYASNRPFVEYLDSIDISEPKHFRQIVQSVCRFSLTALCCEESLTNEVCSLISESRKS